MSRPIPEIRYAAYLANRGVKLNVIIPIEVYHAICFIAKELHPAQIRELTEQQIVDIIEVASEELCDAWIPIIPLPWIYPIYEWQFENLGWPYHMLDTPYVKPTYVPRSCRQ